LFNEKGGEGFNFIEKKIVTSGNLKQISDNILDRGERASEKETERKTQRGGGGEVKQLMTKGKKS